MPRLSPDAEILRVLRHAGEPITRAALYERVKIDDIRDMDTALAKLVRLGKVQPAAQTTYQVRAA